MRPAQVPSARNERAGDSAWKKWLMSLPSLDGTDYVLTKMRKVMEKKVGIKDGKISRVQRIEKIVAYQKLDPVLHATLSFLTSRALCLS